MANYISHPISATLTDQDGNPTGALTNPVRIDPTGTTVQPVSVSGTPSVTASGTVTANQGTPGSQAWKIDGSAVTQPVSLPAGQAVELLDSGGANKASISAAGAVKVDGSAVTQPVSGTVTGNQGSANTAANAWPAKITDGTNIAAVKAASTSAAATDPSAVVQLSPNQPALTTPLNTNVAQVGGTAATATAKGTQAANGIGVQDLKDAGRTYITFTLDAIAGVTSEALASMAINKAETTSSATSYTVTSGKTLRLQSIAVMVRATSTTALTAARVRLRTAASSISITSPLLGTWDACPPTAAALSGARGDVDQSWPDGLEIAGGHQIAISQIISSTSSAVTVTLVGYEY